MEPLNKSELMRIFQENYLKDKLQPPMPPEMDHSIDSKAPLLNSDNNALQNQSLAMGFSKTTPIDSVSNPIRFVGLNPEVNLEDSQATIKTNPLVQNINVSDDKITPEKKGFWQNVYDGFDGKRTVLSLLNGMSNMAGKRSFGDGIAALSQGVRSFNKNYNQQKQADEDFQSNFEALKASGVPEQQAHLIAQDPVFTRQYFLQNFQEPKDSSKDLTEAGFRPEEVSLSGQDPIGVRQAVDDKMNARNNRNQNQDIESALNYSPVVQRDNNGRPMAVSQEEFLKASSPADTNLVQSVANDQIPMEKITSLREPTSREKMAKLASIYDPTFDRSQYNTRAAMPKSITSGNYSQSLNAANLAIQHLATLQDAGKALDNSNWPTWNKVGNAYAAHTGDSRIKRFKLAADAVGSELAKVFKGSGVTSDRQIREWTENLSPDMSPEQLKAAIHTAMDLLGARIDTINQQYHSTMGHPMGFEFFTPKAKQALSKLGIKHGLFLNHDELVSSSDEIENILKGNGG